MIDARQPEKSLFFFYDAAKFVLVSVFTFIESFALKVVRYYGSRVKKPLPVDLRRAKTSLLKLHRVKSTARGLLECAIKSRML